MSDIGSAQAEASHDVIGAAESEASFPQMPRVRRFLLIDDNPDDRALTRRELRRIFPNALIEEVNDAQKLKGALQTSFDLAITDYQLRWTDGLAVLRQLKQHQPECPVIMFTGTGSEELAVEAMKSGLNDYVLKSPRHYLRLATAVSSLLDKVETERRAARLEMRLQSLLNRLDVGVFRATPAGEVMEANPAFFRIIGEEAEAIPPEACPPRQPVNIRSLFPSMKNPCSGGPADGPLHAPAIQIVQSDGSSRWVSVFETLSRTLDGEVFIDGLVEEITDQVAMESRLRQGVKMESIGRLAAGVAHDFNNIVTIIQGYISLLMNETNPSPEASQFLNQIFAASERAATITRQLLMFSRKQMIQPKPLELNEVVRKVAKLLGPLMGNQVTLQLRCAASLPPCRADAGMLEQILINLAVNARDAMPAGGMLTIATGHQVLTPSAAQRFSGGAEPGEYLSLNVSDTGCGMEPAILERIFEPFFTTKDVGKGTGLGLAAVYGIIKQHNGWIDVASTPGLGSSFHILLPVQPVENEPNRSAAQPEPRKRILVVEDEAALREMLCDILQEYGFEVFAAASGIEALDQWQLRLDEIDLLLTDLRMPEGLTGLELAEKLTARKPTLKVLYTSGYSVETVDPRYRLESGANFLPKPYQADLLVKTIRSSLALSTSPRN
jgi:two-component system, cell cycle sensor histidine kinase and response regulator CckA